MNDAKLGQMKRDVKRAEEISVIFSFLKPALRKIKELPNLKISFFKEDSSGCILIDRNVKYWTPALKAILEGAIVNELEALQVRLEEEYKKL